MFQKFSLVAATVVTLVSLNSSAQYMGLEVGVRQQSVSAEAAGVGTNTEMALQFGLAGAFPISEALLFRTGFLYTQRPITVKGTPDIKYTFNYLDIPLTLMWKFNEFGGVYGGVNLAMVASADCSNCGAASVDKKSLMPLVIGGTFKFAPNLGIDVYYEMANQINDSFKEGRAVGANLLVTFD